MITTTQKYNQLKEGKISNKQFLEFVRKDSSLRGIITPMQSFYDTIITLKNRNIISETLDSYNFDKAVRSATAELEGSDNITDDLIQDIAGKWSEFYDLSTAETNSVVNSLMNALGGSDEGSDYQYSDVSAELDETEFADEDEFADDSIDNNLNIDKNSSLDEYTDEIQQILRDKGVDDEEIEILFNAWGNSIKNSFKLGSSPHSSINLMMRLNHDNDAQDKLNENNSEVSQEGLEKYAKDVIRTLMEDYNEKLSIALENIRAMPQIVKKNYKTNIHSEKTAEMIHNMNNDTPNIGKYHLNEGYDNVDKEQLKIDNLNPNQIADGTKVEFLKQKIKDIKKAREIAIKNLLKDPIYYTHLLAGVTVKKKRTDLPIELDKKFSNTKDKANEEKEIKGVEKDKASANKANKETQKIPTYKEDTFKAQRAKGIKGVMDMPGKEKKIKLSEIQRVATAIKIALKEISIQPKGTESIKYYKEAEQIKRGIQQQYPDARIIKVVEDYTPIAAVVYANDKMEVNINRSSFSIATYHPDLEKHSDEYWEKQKGVLIEEDNIQECIDYINNNTPEEIISQGS